ncbi:MAG TPA: cytochrome c [Pseudoneobacillus sp.]|nr:cytochrome c [Pseudoneobacillus sp.]
MNRNPIVPFVLIMVFGIGLMFFLSFKGLGDNEEITKEAEGGEEPKTEEVASSNPEDLYKQSCIGCHGDAYQGGVGPALKGVGDRLSKDQIKEVITKGRGAMPANMVAADQADAVADWLATLK